MAKKKKKKEKDECFQHQPTVQNVGFRFSFFFFFWAPTPVKSDTDDKLGRDGLIFFSPPPITSLKILTEKNPIFLHRPAVAVLL